MSQIAFQKHSLSLRTQLERRNPRSARGSRSCGVLATGTQHDPDGGLGGRGLGYPQFK
jgi:hypothetical protein